MTPEKQQRAAEYKPLRTAIIGGTSLLHSPIFSAWSKETTDTPYGSVQFLRKDFCLFIQRHGDPPLPPHMIDHRACVQALADLGADRVIAVNSVGSLNKNIEPGSFLIPDDFISFGQIPTFFDDRMRFMIPEMDTGMARFLTDLCRDTGLKVHLGGTYIQTTGPRLETRAEIRLLKEYGDVVGMTMASEATLCMERGIPYASICSVDNYGHGIADVPLTMAEIEANVAGNMRAIESLINTIIKQGAE